MAGIEAAGTPSVPIVLRVKRKRAEDPADALVIAKIKKLDPLATRVPDTSIFHFMGTVADQNVSNRAVLERIKRHRDHSSLAKLNPLARLSLSDRQQHTREHKKDSSSTQRFKMVSKLRALGTEEEEENGSSTVDRPVKELTSELMHLYDVIQEEAPGGSTANEEEATSRMLDGANVPQSASGQSTITCNSAPMVREKVKPKTGSCDYVYDLYYTPDCSQQELTAFDWTSLAAYEAEFVHDLLDPDEEEPCDDEDDSNDESNWRNDYPDEESGGPGSSDSEEDYGRSSASYRHREAYYG